MTVGQSIYLVVPRDSSALWYVLLQLHLNLQTDHPKWRDTKNLTRFEPELDDIGYKPSRQEVCSNV